eukprot:CAMPEP_0177728830 /NCGR_PEP_ID=MMETSP0484_2-20121128/21096_1 /TAXON_ID=354590 /ORGANISM="Rhodomonas lens, Strain RHODO" /LENGTH=373 /DNA_ID=CAMNT_0019241641 /DNA_START=88 /DNA_END=1205 /DNA_ORIENTATION=+
MGKVGKLRKKRRLERELTKGGAEAEIDEEEEYLDEEDTKPPVGTTMTLHDIVSATRVITAMAQNPDGFKGKEYKSLRAALHALRQSEGASMVLGFGKHNISLSQVVSDALRDQRWSDALSGLHKMRTQRQIPKLGAVCRWVRECDAAGEGGNSDAMLVLDAVLRTADPPQVGAMQTREAEASLRDAATGKLLQPEERHGGQVLWYEAWDPFGREPVRVEEAGATLRAAKGQSEEALVTWRSKFRACWWEAGDSRRPPNRYDLVIHTSREPGAAIPLAPRASREAQTTRRDCPFVPGAFMLENVFSKAECEALICAGEAVGFDADQPAGGSALGKKSVLAHAFVWCTDQTFIDELWARVGSFMPPEMAGGLPVG